MIDTDGDGILGYLFYLTYFILVYLFYPSRHTKGKKRNGLSNMIRRNMTIVLVPHCAVV